MQIKRYSDWLEEYLYFRYFRIEEELDYFYESEISLKIKFTPRRERSFILGIGGEIYAQSWYGEEIEDRITAYYFGIMKNRFSNNIKWELLFKLGEGEHWFDPEGRWWDPEVERSQYMFGVTFNTQYKF